MAKDEEVLEALPTPGEIGEKFLADDPDPTPEVEPEKAAADASESADATALSQKHFDELRERVERAEKRQEDTRAEYQRTRAELEAARRIADSFTERQNRERELYERAQRMTPPSVEDPSKLYDDPKNLVDYIAQNRDYLLNATRGEFGPVIQELIQRTDRLAKLEEVAMGSAQRGAEAAAREIVQNAGFDDFDEFLPVIRETLTKSGHAAVLADPEAVADAYYLARRRSGKTWTQPEKRKPPTMSRPNGSVATRSRGIDPAVAARLSPMAAEISRYLGEDFKPTADQLAAVGLIPKEAR